MVDSFLEESNPLNFILTELLPDSNGLNVHRGKTPVIVIRLCLGWYIVALLLMIGLVQDGRYDTYICCGSDCQMKPLGPDVFDVVLEIVHGIIKVGVRLVDI